MPTVTKEKNDATSLRDVSTPTRWRFGLRSIFWLMLLVGVALAIERLFGFLYLVVVILFAVPVVIRRRTTSFDLALCRSAVAYLVVSIATLPFLDSLWFGELPVFALPQIPKTELAWWFTNRIIYNVMGPMGWSYGSWSPDVIRAKPIGLALAYAVSLSSVFAIVGWRTQFTGPYRYWLAAILALAVVDFMMMRLYASGPGLTIY